VKKLFTLQTSYVLVLVINLQTDRAQIQKGASSARSDDTKSLKSAILDWITPRGQPLRPQLARNVKTDRGFHHERTGALLCPAGLDWSNTEFVFSYALIARTLTNSRTKERLQSGEMAVPGDLWPIFLYHGYNFDPEDPWNGLFRSSLLISVGLIYDNVLAHQY
jgi:hypothetical protein